MEVNFVSKTESKDYTPEGLIAFIARCSSPNQTNPEYKALFKYCIDHGHWSIFEQAYMTVEIHTCRGISPQLLRHRSFTFQEFSQRYAQVPDSIDIVSAREQDTKNRQNSTNTLPPVTTEWFNKCQEDIWHMGYLLYEAALSRGIAKEQARLLLPALAPTTLYMTGSVRSWIHYLQLRTDPSTQKEHRDIAEGIKKIFCEHYPTIGELLWSKQISDT